MVLSIDCEQSHSLNYCRRSPTTQTTKAGLRGKTISGGELKKLVGWYVVEEMLHLNMVDSHSFCAIINKIPTTINAMLGVTVKNALPMGKTSCHFYVEAVEVLLAAAECN